MPILIDLSPIAIANITANPSDFNNGKDTDLIKHMIINSLRIYKNKFKGQYGDMIICCDGDNNWRRKVFPHYKSGRIKMKQKSFLDWTLIKKTIDEVVVDLQEYFPYKTIKIDGVEADDIIAILAMSTTEKTMIISSDKDYGQLQKYEHVSQFCPRKKEFLVINNPKKQLFELIVRGDTSDGIPNIKSVNNSFADGIRQVSVYQKEIDVWDDKILLEDEKYSRRYKENRILIDFDYIPSFVKREVLRKYDLKPKGNKSTLMDYFAEKEMVNFFGLIGQF